MNFTTHKKYFPASSRNTLKCCTCTPCRFSTLTESENPPGADSLSRNKYAFYSIYGFFLDVFFGRGVKKSICQQNFKVLALNVYQGYVRACVNVHVSTRTRMCVDVRHAKCAGVSANVAKVKRCKKKIFYKKVFTYAIVRRRQQYFFGFYTSNLAMHPWVWE